MPPKIDKSQPQINQEKCKDCTVKTVNKPNDKAVECDICQEWVCFKCSGLTEQVYQISVESECYLDFICKPCKLELPRIREIITLKQKQNEIIEGMKREEETNKKFREAQNQTNQDFEQRLASIEKVIREKNLDTEDWPPLAKLKEDNKKLNKIIVKQKEIDEVVNQQNTIMYKQQKHDEEVKKQKGEKEEEKRRDDREENLVVYGIPEEHADDTEQMKADYSTVKKLYHNRVELTTKDILQITRLGLKKVDLIRPIRIAFTSMAKRTEILRNNRDLKLEGEQFQVCTATFCEQNQKHQHIYVSTDKTKQQREEEKKLRDELKARRNDGETNLVIRNNKIITKPTATNARWVDVVKNGF